MKSWFMVYGSWLLAPGSWFMAINYELCSLLPRRGTRPLSPSPKERDEALGPALVDSFFKSQWITKLPIAF